MSCSSVVEVGQAWRFEGKNNKILTVIIAEMEQNKYVLCSSWRKNAVTSCSRLSLRLYFVGQ